MRRTFTDGGRTYTLAMDRALPAGAQMSAIVRMQLRDELTQKPPLGAIRITTPQAAAVPRTGEFGIAGLAGFPSKVLPFLATQAYDVNLEVDATGYVPMDLSVTFAIQATFPETFTPADLGTVDLHREPVSLSGRVYEQTPGGLVPLAGASVTMLHLWLTYPPADVVVPGLDPNIVSLRSPTYFGRTTATGRVRQRDLNPVPGDLRMLLREAGPTSTALQVSNRNGLNAGDVLALSEGDSDRVEYLIVQTIEGGSSADDQATITLEYPPRSIHAEGARVVRVTLGAPGFDNPLLSPIIPGDMCLLLASMSGLGAGSALEIIGGAHPAEYHLFFRFDATSDANGFYRMPPVSRVAQAEFEASGPPGSATITITPDYGLPRNRMDFVIV